MGVPIASLHVVTDPEAIGTPIQAGGALVYPMPYLEPDLVRQSLSDLPAQGEADLVVAVGGDGTIHEVVSGLMERPPAARASLGVIPCGNGNDFARAPR